MPIRTPDGYLDITNATLRGSEIITTSKVGIANSAPTHTLSVGNKLFVDDSAANVLTVTGNLVATSLKIGQIDLAPSYALEHVANVGNTISNVVQFTNTGTGFVSASNVGIGTTTSPAGLFDVVGAFRMRYQDMGVTKAHIITGANSTSITESGGTYTYTRAGSSTTGNFLPNPSNIVPKVGQRYRVKLTARSDYAGTIRYECPTSTIITTYDLTTSFKEYTWDFTATGTTMQFAVTTVSGTTSQFNAFSIERLGVGFNVNPTSTAAPVQISGVTHFSDNVGIGTASPSHPLTIQETTTNTNTVTYPLAIRAISSGTVANGFGAGIRFQCERTDTDNYQSFAGSVEVYGAGNLPGTSDLWNMRFGVRNNDTAVTPMTLRYNGNVGIGTNNPIAKLDIDGGAENNTTPALAIRGGLFDPSDLYVLNSYSVTSGVGYAAKVIGVNIKNKVETDNTVQIRNNVGGLISAGAIYFGSDNVNQGIFGVLGGTGNVGTTLAEYLTVRDDGNVGIGTASPLEKLDVYGTSRISSAYPRLDFFCTTGRSTNAWGNSTGAAGDYRIYSNGDASDGTKRSLNFDYGQNTTHTTRMCINADGNVGIGTASPDHKLHIYANDTSNTQLILRNNESTARTGISLLNAAGQYFNIQHVGGAGLDSNAAVIENFSTTNGGIQFYNKGDGEYIFRTTDSNNLRFSIRNNGNVGVGGITPSSKLHVDGDVRMKTLSTNAIGKITPVYARGTGSNNVANRIVRIGDTTHVNSATRGLTLTIINASTHAHVSSVTYDTYGFQTSSDALATALEGMTDAQIGILTSWDAFEDNMTGNLITACLKLGLTRLAGANDDMNRHPYCAIFYGPGASGVAGNHAIEVMKSDSSSGAHATLSTFLVDDSFMGQTVTNALYSGTGDDTTPAMFVSKNGTVGIGFGATPSNSTRSLHIKRGTSYPSSGSAVEILQRLGTNNYIYEGQHRAQLRINNQQGTYSNRSLEFALCDNGTGVIQANAGSEGYFPLCLNPASGNVAIRHMSPSYPLHVASSGGSMPSMKYFTSGSTNIASGSGDAITIYAAGNIYASGLVAASDERIKKEIVDADDAECLETLRLLKPKRYRYRDEINRGQEPVWGFIAQEVRETLPYATRLSRQAIPNIYELANVSSSNVITFTNFNTSDLEANATTIQVQTAADMEESVTIAEIIDEHAIRVEEDLSNWTGSVDETGNVVTGNQLFVYGQKMDDFVLLKKDAIWTVTTAALQEVDRQLQTEKTKTTTLETELQAEKTKTSTFETELQAEKTKTTTLETKLQEAEAKIATLQAEKEAIRSDLSSLVLRVTALES